MAMERCATSRPSWMLAGTQFYGQIVASLVQRGAALYDVAFGKRGADAGGAARPGS